MSLVETAIHSFLDRTLAKNSAAPVQTAPADHSLVKGLLAGLAAGVAATAAKTIIEKVYPPRTHGEAEPPAVLADKLAGHELAPVSGAVATETIHWAFGATAGAAYGALAEFYPAVTAKEGVTFGMTLMALTHESALPAMGLGAAPGDQTMREKTSEMASHMIYGLVAEATRKFVRARL